MDGPAEEAQVEGIVAEPRTYAEWLDDARKSNDRQRELANELRKCWDDWKADSEYATWEECIQAEFGMSAGALRERNSYRRRKARKVVEPTQEATNDVEPAESESVRMPDGPDSFTSPPESDQEPRSTARPRRERAPVGPAHVRARAITSACNAASRYAEALVDLSVAEYETYAKQVERVIAEWEGVRDSLQGSVAA